jgi:hypothetical protein
MPSQRPGNDSLCLRQGLVQVREVGDDAGDTGEREDAEHGAGRDDQQQLTTVDQGSLMGPHQHLHPGRIAEPGAGHVHHRRPPARCCLPEYLLETLGVRSVDVHRRTHNRNATDHHEWVPGISHWCHLPPWRIVVGASPRGQWFYVAGILKPAVLAPEIDSAVLIGFPAAQTYLDFDGHPSQIYVRTTGTQAATTTVDALLGYQANPENPS